ncbi:hypothetical protein ACH51_05450 [Ralstonia solanacearum]|nr:hypothetical protein ACH51_05450 [Ralstonia solanacearum]
MALLRLTCLDRFALGGFCRLTVAVAAAALAFALTFTLGLALAGFVAAAVAALALTLAVAAGLCTPLPKSWFASSSSSVHSVSFLPQRPRLRQR